MYVLEPSVAALSRSVEPVPTSTDCHIGISFPSSLGCISAPVIAITAFEWNRNTGPVIVHSSAAADSGFPAIQFAMRNASESIGPDGGTPTFQYPRRPG